MLDDFRDEDVNSSGEFLDEFRQRLNSQPIENIEEKKATVGRSQQIFLSAVLGIGLAGLVSWFIFSPEYSKIENVEIPVVRRPQTAVKVQPADPGGMEIPNQDKTIYDIVEKKADTEERVEKLLPPPEDPVALEIQSPNESQEIVENKESDVVAAAEEILQAQEQAAAADMGDKAVIEKEVVSIKERPIETVEAPVVKAKEEFVNKVKQEAVGSDKKEDIPSGRWQVQLISSPNSAAVDKAWKDLKRKYPALESLPHETETADLGSKGLFYRLMVGAFMDRGDADKLCNTIKNSGGTCLVKKK